MRKRSWNYYFGLAGGSAANGGAQSSLGPRIKTVSVAAVEELQSLRGHAPVDRNASKAVQSAADAAEAMAQYAIVFLCALTSFFGRNLPA